MAQPTHLEAFNFFFNQHGYKLREIQNHPNNKEILAWGRWENTGKDKIVIHNIRLDGCESYMQEHIKNSVESHIEAVKKNKLLKAAQARRKAHRIKWNV